MTNLTTINQHLHGKSAQQIIEWALLQHATPHSRSIISTHFGPYEAVLLHLVTQVKPDIDVVWVDNGYATNDTYRVANKIIEQLGLNIHIFVPQRTQAYLNVRYNGLPELDTPEHDEFTHILKLEPFNRALATLNPALWFTALRKEQSALRQQLDTVTTAGDNLIKISPILNWTTQDMQDYIKQHNLPNELNYFDPTKGPQGRECGLHKVKF
ncbi:phosphoadenylylsulfate reductase (thioredoxin) [Orbus hercynius]|uniref:Phosphoadenylylsulfate reductase (Thioredoxin) n=1 Tax=Orbus hercynius TaxID=593135 RepID=A0A495RKW4_9GAMM|nr:phosphoadenosine phosphosulfate reductase family protein [Orbus hercynius]RKS87816.1 phosphoadenylylsulfate reductase (thioredoxin) [Orbus hercynius]